MPQIDYRDTCSCPCHQVLDTPYRGDVTCRHCRGESNLRGETGSRFEGDGSQREREESTLVNVKQVLVINRGLKCRRGKEIAQGAHASIAWLANAITRAPEGKVRVRDLFSDFEWQWLTGPFAKIVLQVDSDEELLRVFGETKRAGLKNVIMITDAGKTEFDGVPTRTCIGIGPDDAAKIDTVTGELKLY